MSYILDALRRADAERERGAVPTLHAQPGMGLPAAGGGGRAAVRWWVGGGVIAALLVAVGVLAWRVGASNGDGPARAVVSVVPASAAASSVSAPSTRTETASAAVTVPGAASSGGATRVPGVAAASRAGSASSGGPAGSARTPAPALPKAATPAPRLASRPPVAEAAPRRPVPARAASAPPADAAADVDQSRVYAASELPPEVQRALPALAFSGASYSDNAASRMLIVNGQVFHEGDALGPDLTLERIALKSAVLRYRTWRYRVSY